MLKINLRLLAYKDFASLSYSTLLSSNVDSDGMCAQTLIKILHINAFRNDKKIEQFFFPDKDILI